MKRVLVCVLLLAVCIAAAVPVLALDQYGGYESLHGNNSSGYFRTERINGKYWFVTPDNHAFFLTGPCWWDYIPSILTVDGGSKAWRANFFHCPSLGYKPVENSQRVRYADEGSWITTNKTRLITNWKFTATGPGGITYDPYISEMFECANITGCVQAWGDDYTTAVRDCGVVDWSDGSQPDQITSGNTVGRSVPSVNDNFCDVFDSRFLEVAKTAVNVSTVPDYDTDPYRIGIFPDSEIRWGHHLFQNMCMYDVYCAQDSSTWAKQYWVNWLKTHYSNNLTTLNNTYGTSFNSWEGSEWNSVKNCVRINLHLSSNADFVVTDECPALTQDKIEFSQACIFSDISAGTNPYYDIVDIVLPDCFIALPSPTAGKQAWVNALKTYYSDNLTSLNSAFGTSFTSWDNDDANSVKNCVRIANNGSYPARRARKLEFMGTIADTYYDKVTDAIKYYDSNHLIIADRYCAWYDQMADNAYNTDFMNTMLTKAGLYCDVMAANSYVNTRDFYQWWQRMFTYGKKPIMISENSYGANDWNGPTTPWENQLATQVLRAEEYVDQIQYASDFSMTDPNDQSTAYPWVGVTWFDYYDQAALGQAGGAEASNFGLVNVMDEPYSIFTDACAGINDQLYAHRAGGTGWNVYSGASLSSPSDGATVTTATPTFQWSAASQSATYGSPGTYGSPSSYELLISAEKSFPEDQTIRINVGNNTSCTLASSYALARGTWYWTVGAVDSSGRKSLYGTVRKLNVNTTTVNLTNNYACAEVTAWRMQDVLGASNGKGGSFVFRDTSRYVGGCSSSAKVVMTPYSWNKLSDSSNKQASPPYGPNYNILADFEPGTSSWSAYDTFAFWIYPQGFYDPVYDTTVASSRYLVVQVYDTSSPYPVLSSTFDTGTLTQNAWNMVTLDISGITRSNIWKITWASNCSWLPAFDQRLVFNIGYIWCYNQ